MSKPSNIVSFIFISFFLGMAYLLPNNEYEWMREHLPEESSLPEDDGGSRLIAVFSCVLGISAILGVLLIHHFRGKRIPCYVILLSFFFTSAFIIRLII